MITWRSHWVTRRRSTSVRIGPCGCRSESGPLRCRCVPKFSCLPPTRSIGGSTASTVSVSAKRDYLNISTPTTYTRSVERRELTVSKTVIVFGGGIGGLSTAHELSERGFSVRVFERRDVPGGKARSVVVPSTAPRQNVGAMNLGKLAAPTRRDLPGEHGFRFFPRFYQHIIDTMARTPYRGSRSVAENLVDTTDTIFARFGHRPLKLPTITPSNVPELFTLVSDLGSWFSPSASRPRTSPSSRAHLADPHQLPGAPAGRIRADRLVGLHRGRALAGLSEVLRYRHHPIAGRRQGAARQRQDDRRHVHADLSSTWPSPRWRRPGAERSDQRRVDRSLADVPARTRRRVSPGRACALDQMDRGVVRGVMVDRKGGAGSHGGLLHLRSAGRTHGQDRPRPGPRRSCLATSSRSAGTWSG